MQHRYEEIKLTKHGGAFLGSKIIKNNFSGLAGEAELREGKSQSRLKRLGKIQLLALTNP